MRNHSYWDELTSPLAFIPLAIICLLVFVGLSDSHAQQTIDLTPVRDNSIYAENTTTSNGAGDIFVGFKSRGEERRALLKFDLSPLNGMRVLTAELEITVAQTNAPDGLFSVHALTQDWGEADSTGGGSGGPAQLSDATWGQRFFPDVDWLTEGGDFESNPLTTTNIGDAPNSFVFPSSFDFVVRVQQWLDQPETNFGVILIGDNARSKRLQSREASAGFPVLRVVVELDEIFADGFER